jgi:hypothetical protein
MARYILQTTRDRLPEVGAFIRERIPHDHRSCWSIYKRRRFSAFDPNGQPYVAWDYDFWFARRYESIGFELKMRFG